MQLIQPTETSLRMRGVLAYLPENEFQHLVHDSPFGAVDKAIEQVTKEVEVLILSNALEKYKGCVADVADELNVSTTTIYRWCNNAGMSNQDYK